MNPLTRERIRTDSGSFRGFFVTLEGIEGSGKSTHARLLETVLGERGYPVVPTREPGGTSIGEAIRDVLMTQSEPPPTPETELFLMLAARAQHVTQVILPQLNRGRVVLSDRYADASLAYQGGGRELGVGVVAGANELATGSLVPDLTLLFDIPVDEAIARVTRRGDEGGEYNRFDREKVQFFEAVRATYLDLAHRNPERFVVLDSRRDREVVAGETVEAVESRLLAAREKGCID